jgi:hypothetical protein
VFVVTARHVVRDWPLRGLRIFPSDQATQSLPLVQGYNLITNDYDSDASDLSIIKVDLASVPASDRKSSNLIRVPKVVPDWLQHAASAAYFCFGFPVGPIQNDYSVSSVSTTQYMLTGTYVGPSVGSECYELAVRNPLGLEDFNGMSGSPVFSLASGLRPSAPIFAGMLLRGTAKSGRVHFLDFERIFAALHSADRGYFV